MKYEKNKDIQKLHTTARLVLGKIFEEAHEKLAGKEAVLGELMLGFIDLEADYKRSFSRVTKEIDFKGISEDKAKKDT